jgi:ribonuclease R
MARKPKSAKGATSTPRGLPSKDKILEFLRSSTEKVGKREIARAFGIRGDARTDLKRLLAEMRKDGKLAGSRKTGVRKQGTLPPVAVLEVTGRDAQGDLIAKPTVWDTEEGERPAVLVLVGHSRGPSADIQADIGIGDQVLARITELSEPDVEGFRYEARKQLRSWSIKKGDEGEAEDGDLVHFDLVRRGRLHVPQARILESLGNPGDQRQISLIAIHTHGLPVDFPESVLNELKHLTPPKLKERTDLRDLPLVTIDPPDARDHDDAVYAEADSDPKNKGGWVVIVAIADVAHYVRSGTKLDREAKLRGNSVYFPDRVVPMLPEHISNDLCSLREGEDRPCLAVRMVVDAHGSKRSQTFLRAMMRSAAKLSYQEAQAAIDGKPSTKCKPLLEPVLKPLWAAYAALAQARNRREPLDLDLPERKIVLDNKGQVERVDIPERLAAHRLVEEFMIQANVAAAEALEGKRAPVVYRIHDRPSQEKLKNLREFLDSLDMKLAPPCDL